MSTVASSNIPHEQAARSKKRSSKQHAAKTQPHSPPQPAAVPPTDSAHAIEQTIEICVACYHAIVRPNDPASIALEKNYDWSEFAADPKVDPEQILSILVQNLSKNLSLSCFIAASYYLEKLHRKVPHLVICKINYGRWFLIALAIAAKYVEDFFYTASQWCAVFGNCLSPVKFTAAEAEFLSAISYELYTDEVLLETFSRSLLGSAVPATLPILPLTRA